MSDRAEDAEDIISLYRRAFADFGPRALWNSKAVAEPTVGYQRNPGAFRGIWPSSPEISRAMLERDVTATSD